MTQKIKIKSIVLIKLVLLFSCSKSFVYYSDSTTLQFLKNNDFSIEQMDELIGSEGYSAEVKTLSFIEIANFKNIERQSTRGFAISPFLKKEKELGPIFPEMESFSLDDAFITDLKEVFGPEASLYIFIDNSSPQFQNMEEMIKAKSIASKLKLNFFYGNSNIIETLSKASAEQISGFVFLLENTNPELFQKIEETKIPWLSLFVSKKRLPLAGLKGKIIFDFSSQLRSIVRNESYSKEIKLKIVKLYQ